MFITSTQMTAFFAEPVQMDLPAATHVAITQEGLEYLAYIVKFDKKNIKQITDNLRCPDGRVPDPDPNAAVGATILTPDCVFGANIQFLLKAEFNIAQYYKTTGRSLIAANMRWNPIINNSTEHWKSLTARKDATDSDVPNISKNLHII